ncbi:MAG: hypothetical protein JSR45_08650 [Proteobacteria bacterium]|nr:hypothetical protein [Pseudomonadota bacterium]
MIADDEGAYGIRFRTEISIDIDAVDYLAAAEHQKQIELMLRDLRAAYPNLVMSVRPRRAPRVRRAAEASRLRHYTGRLNTYE